MPSWSGTFHGIGARLLRDYSDQIGLDPQFTIHDREDSADLMNLIRHEKGFSKTEGRLPTKGTCLSIHSRCVNAETAIEQVLGASFPWCSGWAAELKELFAAYVEAKQKQNVLDYDDLLLYWAQTMSNPALADDIGGRFDHVLVDEYQDTNRLQSSILLGLKPGGHGLTVVGDDAQSIYSFRAATVRNILDFPTQFAPPASIITLDRNYRSTQTILAAANGVIDLAKERFTKLWTERTSGAKPQLITVRDEADQARCIVERVLENRESGTLLKRAGGAVQDVEPERTAGSRIDPAQHSVREVRRAEVSRCRTHQGHAGAAALSRDLLTLAEAHAREHLKRERNLRFFDRLPREVREITEYARCRASVLLDAGRAGDAERIFRGIIRAKPQDVYAYLRLFESLARLRRQPEVAAIVLAVDEVSLQGPSE
jgi:superfamily I DNA/RNA helicase